MYHPKWLSCQLTSAYALLPILPPVLQSPSPHYHEEPAPLSIYVPIYLCVVRIYIPRTESPFTERPFPASSGPEYYL
jgi:hypothetical protein